VLPGNVALRHGAIPVTLAHDVQKAVNCYHGGAATGGMADTFGALADVDGLEASEDREEELEQVGDGDDAPGARLVNAIMGEALHSRASDIHIEPQERDCGSGTASTGCCARSRWSPSRSRGR
jgi:hypothetical protein